MEPKKPNPKSLPSWVKQTNPTEVQLPMEIKETLNKLRTHFPELMEPSATEVARYVCRLKAMGASVTLIRTKE